MARVPVGAARRPSPDHTADLASRACTPEALTQAVWHRPSPNRVDPCSPSHPMTCGAVALSAFLRQRRSDLTAIHLLCRVLAFLRSGAALSAVVGCSSPPLRSENSSRIKLLYCIWSSHLHGPELLTSVVSVAKRHGGRSPWRSVVDCPRCSIPLSPNPPLPCCSMPWCSAIEARSTPPTRAALWPVSPWSSLPLPCCSMPPAHCRCHSIRSLGEEGMHLG